MTDERLELVEPSEGLREEYVAFVEDFSAAGEPYHQEERQQARADFAAFLRRLEDNAACRNLEAGHVPSSTYWLARGRRIVGTGRLRQQLSDALRQDGGNIGYDIRPSERGKGHATRLLRLMLDKARQLGLQRVLITCNEDNAASARVIEKNGGVRDSDSASRQTGQPMRRYWIEL